MSDAVPALWDRRKLIRESSLTVQQKCLLMVIDDYCGDGGECFASNERLAEECSLSIQQLLRILKSLKDAKLIKSQRRKYQPTVLEIDWKSLSDFAPVRSLTGENSHTGQSDFAPVRSLSTYRTTNELPVNKKARKNQSSKFDPKQIQLPAALETDAFKKAWSDFCDHRSEMRKPITQNAAKLMLNKLEKRPEVAVLAIEKAIESGWTSVFPESIAERPKGNHHANGSSKRTNSGQVYDPSSRDAEIII